jgi:Holliday junction DNA helicase RuvA
LELKDKVARLHPTGQPVDSENGVASNPLFEDALSALVNLGYRPQDVKDTLRKIEKSDTTAYGLKDIIREALKELAKR